MLSILPFMRPSRGITRQAHRGYVFHQIARMQAGNHETLPRTGGKAMTTARSISHLTLTPSSFRLLPYIHTRFPAPTLLPSPFRTCQPGISLARAMCLFSFASQLTNPCNRCVPGEERALHYNYQPYRPPPKQNHIVPSGCNHIPRQRYKTRPSPLLHTTMSSSSTSSSPSSPFTLPFHLAPPHQRDPTTSPRLPPLLNMSPAKQPTHALCGKNAAAAAAEQQREPTTIHQGLGDDKWRAAARGDLPAPQTIGQTANGRQPTARQTDARERRDDGGWVDWVGW